MITYALDNAQAGSANVAASTLSSPPTELAALETQRHAVRRRNNVHVVGEGKPPLLLCNGFGCNQHIWRYLTPALSRHYQLVFFDHVGSGESDLAAYDPQKYSTLAGYAQDVVEICQVLGLRDVVLVGHSMGATIAALAAIQAPAYFAKAILLAASPCYINEPGYHGGFERDNILQLLAAMEADYSNWTNLFADLLMGQASDASLGEELARNFCNMDSTIARQLARATFLADNRADIVHLQLPVLLVQCTDDVVAPAEVGAYLRDHLPQAKLVTLSTKGHCPHLSAPLNTLAEIQAFLGLAPAIGSAAQRS